MEIFSLTLTQMLLMFTLILVGFFLRKKSILPDNSDASMAKLETYIFVPALSLYTQITKCTAESFKENAFILLYGLIVTMVAIIISYPLSKLFIKNTDSSPVRAYQKNIYKYALTFGNYGFMGNFIILGVWGADMFYKYTLFTFSVSLFCYSWGLYMLIPRDKNVSLLANIKKGLLTPPMLALAAGTLLGLANAGQYMPQFLLNALNSAGACQGPVAMVLAGFIIGGYNLKEILLNKKVYAASILRLIFIPAALMLILKLIGTTDELMTLVLIAFATPLGLNTIVYPAAYDGETKTGASMTMISHTLSVITIPLMYLIFIVML